MSTQIEGFNTRIARPDHSGRFRDFGLILEPTSETTTRHVQNFIRNRLKIVLTQHGFTVVHGVSIEDDIYMTLEETSSQKWHQDIKTPVIDDICMLYYPQQSNPRLAVTAMEDTEVVQETLTKVFEETSPLVLYDLRWQLREFNPPSYYETRAFAEFFIKNNLLRALPPQLHFRLQALLLLTGYKNSYADTYNQLLIMHNNFLRHARIEAVDPPPKQGMLWALMSRNLMKHPERIRLVTKSVKEDNSIAA